MWVYIYIYTHTHTTRLGLGLGNISFLAVLQAGPTYNLSYYPPGETEEHRRASRSSARRIDPHDRADTQNPVNVSIKQVIASISARTMYTGVKQ